MAKLKWLVELSVDTRWVADGFDLTEERAKEMLARTLPYAYDIELDARILGSPDPERIAKLQGYQNAKDRKQRRRP